MKYENLQPDSYFTVNGVQYSGWIPPLKCYGPLRRCSIRISDIVNLLNNDVVVLLTPEQNEALYFFVKQYNALLDLQKSQQPKATRAEQVLYERVYKKALEQEKAEDIENPFISDDEEDIDIVAETISLQSKGTMTGFNDPLKDLKQKKTIIKRPRAYDMFKNDKNESLVSRLDETKMMLEYADTQVQDNILID